MFLPPTFIDTVQRIFGENGVDWLAHLPEILLKCRKKWGLSEGVLCPNLSINYIEYTQSSTGEAVAIKIGVPNAELFTEMDALRLWDGDGAVRLIDSDQALGALLIHRVNPGTLLWQLRDNRKETVIAASIMHKLHKVVKTEHRFPGFSDWVNRAFHLTRTEWDPHEFMPRFLIDRVEQAFLEILKTSDGEVLLHGDLHHENILFDEFEGWTAIDPKGVMGPAVLEVGRFIQNQLPASIMHTVVRERLEIFSREFGKPLPLVAASALVDCILSHCWSFKDQELNEDWSDGVELGYLLSEMTGL
jgi:streptomycin 6-kinase